MKPDLFIKSAITTIATILIGVAQFQIGEIYEKLENRYQEISNSQIEIIKRGNLRATSLLQANLYATELIPCYGCQRNEDCPILCRDPGVGKIIERYEERVDASNAILFSSAEIEQGFASTTESLNRSIAVLHEERITWTRIFYGLSILVILINIPTEFWTLILRRLKFAIKKLTIKSH